MHLERTICRRFNDAWRDNTTELEYDQGVFGASIGLIVGALLAVATLVSIAPKHMIRESRSAYGLDETVARIRAAATTAGWSVSGVRAIDAQIIAHGEADVGTVRLVEMCNARHASAILDNDAQKRFAVLMPCTIAVYRKSDGETYVASLEAALMGRLFPGEVARVFGGSVAREQAAILAGVTATGPDGAIRSE